MIICQSGPPLICFLLITPKILCQLSRSRKITNIKHFLSFGQAYFLSKLFREVPALWALPKSTPTLFTFAVKQRVLWHGFCCTALNSPSDRPCQFVCLDTDRQENLFLLIADCVSVYSSPFLFSFQCLFTRPFSSDCLGIWCCTSTLILLLSISG